MLNIIISNHVPKYYNPISIQIKSNPIQSNPLLFMYNTSIFQTPKIDHHDCDSIFGKPKLHEGCSAR
jgi:hypothetical protein